MTELRIPKPARRGRKPPKPIRALGRKRTSKRRKAKKVTSKDCYKLWSRYVRARVGGRCELLGENFSGYIHAQCNGPVQGMHGFKRSSHPGVRFAAWNGYSGCAGIHRYLSDRELVWHRWLREKWGEKLYEERYTQAVATRKYDLNRVADLYRTCLEAISASPPVD